MNKSTSQQPVTKLQYRLLCEEESIPIYSQDWWMDAIVGDANWDVLLVEQGGRIVGAMPVYIKQRYGLKYVTQGPLTQTNGIWLRYAPDQKYVSRLAFEKKTMNALIDQLEALGLAYYQQSFHPSISNWLPFYWRGFSQTTRYTYRIEDLSDLEQVKAGFSRNVRSNLRKAEGLARVYESDDIGRFYTLIGQTYARQNMGQSFSLSFLERLDRACREHDARRLFFAADAAGNVHCGGYIVYDDKTVYQLMSASDPAYTDSQFQTLLIWEALKFAGETGRSFDFEGSMIEGVEEFYRKFGAIQTPYFTLSKAFRYQPIFRLYMSGRG